MSFASPVSSECEDFSDSEENHMPDSPLLFPSSGNSSASTPGSRPVLRGSRGGKLTSALDVSPPPRFTSSLGGSSQGGEAGGEAAPLPERTARAPYQHGIPLTDARGLRRAGPPSPIAARDASQGVPPPGRISPRDALQFVAWGTQFCPSPRGPRAPRSIDAPPAALRRPIVARDVSFPLRLVRGIHPGNPGHPVVLRLPRPASYGATHALLLPGRPEYVICLRDQVPACAGRLLKQQGRFAHAQEDASPLLRPSPSSGPPSTPTSAPPSAPSSPLPTGTVKKLLASPPRASSPPRHRPGLFAPGACPLGSAATKTGECCLVRQ
ncbi:hypothetical protein T484DRAFT_1760845, partial [Baffinella frigidus]